MIRHARDAFAAGTLTPTKLATQCLTSAHDNHAKLNCFITKPEHKDVLAQAEASDRRWAAGTPLGPLDGIPIAVKDNLCVRDMPCTAGSRMLANFTAPYDATVVSRLRAQGAIIMGKTNMDEFGMGSHGRTSFFGPTINSHTAQDQTQKLSPGGSSSGSAVAVASGACLASLGSDTGGSVRLPAAFCGVAGMKPTYGGVSRHGLISYASSLDCPGVLAASVQDTEEVWRAIRGRDDLDATSTEPPTMSVIENTNLGPAREWRVGLLKELFVDELSVDMKDAWREAAECVSRTGEKKNATVLSVSVPSVKDALAAYYVVASAEAASNLSRYDGVRYGFRSGGDGENENGVNVDSEDSKMVRRPAGDLHQQYMKTRSRGFGDEVKRRLLTGSFVLSSGAVKEYYERAQDIRQQVTDGLDACFKDNDLDAILVPVSPGTPPLLDSLAHQDPVEGYLIDVMTVPFSLAGLPAVSVPFNSVRNPGLPLGMQLVGPRHSEERLLVLASELEAALFERDTNRTKQVDAAV